MPSGPNAENAKDLYDKAFKNKMFAISVGQLNKAHEAEEAGHDFYLGRVGERVKLEGQKVDGSWKHSMTVARPGDHMFSEGTFKLDGFANSPEVMDEMQKIDAIPLRRTATEAMDIVGEGNMGSNIPDTPRGRRGMPAKMRKGRSK
jgi:hypothetical protein